MKQLYPGLILCMLFACNQKPAAIKKETDRRDTIKMADTVTRVAKDTVADEPLTDVESQTGTFYLVEVATGYNFDSLKNISQTAASMLKLPFDMHDRIYKPGKGIIVPENSDDEMYAGAYYPRRPFTGEEFVSIEMSKGMNDENADTLQMVSMAGIYSLERDADSVALLLKNKYPSTRVVKRELYLGCMH